MAATASHRRWRDRGGETSPDRTKVWAEPPPLRRVPVIYYISRNGQLEHPHFMEVPLSSSEGLFLKDVIERLNFLRGKGMASLYSWSSKRSYKHGFVWHDLSESDFIFPAHGNEYILKGSVILEDSSTAAAALTASKPEETVTANSSGAKSSAAGDQEFLAAKPHRRRNQSWSSFDSHEYKVYAGEHLSRAAAADAATQTDDKRRHRRRAIREIEEEVEAAEEIHRQSTTDEISEISPPPTDSSPETLETLLKADGKLVLRPETSAGDDSSGAAAGKSTTKAASVLMQLISCGSIGFRDCGHSGGGGHGKENGFSLISHYKVRLPRGGHGGSNQVGKDSSESDSTAGSTTSGFGGGRGGGVKLEEKEYFSGSLVELETKRSDFPELKRSSSYNADRSSSSQLEVAEVQETNEGGGITKRFLLRKAKASNTHRSTKLGRSTSEVSWQ